MRTILDLRRMDRPCKKAAANKHEARLRRLGTIIAKARHRPCCIAHCCAVKFCAGEQERRLRRLGLVVAKGALRRHCWLHRIAYQGQHKYLTRSMCC